MLTVYIEFARTCDLNVAALVIAVRITPCPPANHRSTNHISKIKYVVLVLLIMLMLLN
jgi:hypothetical protein